MGKERLRSREVKIKRGQERRREETSKSDAMDRFVLLALTVLLAVAEGVCPSNERHYYEGIGCIPQDTDQDGCVTSYDCSSLAGRRADRCYYKGQDYPEGAELNSIPETPCLTNCRCVNFTTRSRFSFDCVRVECPENLGVRPGPGCYYVYEHDRCCGVQKICDADAKSEPGCVVDGRSSKHGQKFFPEAEECLKCICNPGFNGAFVQPFCRNISCNLELVSANYLAEGCVPVYYGEKGCCPIDWRCPTSTDTVVTSPQSSRSSTAKTCQFGGLTLQVGETLSDSPQHRGVQCACRVPPHPVCVLPPNDDVF